MDLLQCVQHHQKDNVTTKGLNSKYPERVVGLNPGPGDYLLLQVATKIHKKILKIFPARRKKLLHDLVLLDITTK